MKSFGKIIIDPLDREISVYSNKNDNKGFDCSSITEQSIRLYDGNGRPYIDLSGHDVAGNDFVTLTNSYNNKGLHLKRIDNASSDDILYILDGLPTSDPKIEGVLWMDVSSLWLRSNHSQYNVLGNLRCDFWLRHNSRFL